MKNRVTNNRHDTQPSQIILVLYRSVLYLPCTDERQTSETRAWNRASFLAYQTRFSTIFTSADKTYLTYPFKNRITTRVGIRKYALRDHRLASLGEASWCQTVTLGRIFLSAPHTHERFLKSCLTMSLLNGTILDRKNGNGRGTHWLMLKFYSFRCFNIFRRYCWWKIIQSFNFFIRATTILQNYI